ncbi:MAG: hypothetical protein RL535_1110, partial [Pseudomonadota bacterium]
MSRYYETYSQDAKIGWPEVNVSVVYKYEPYIPARGDNAPEDGSCTVLEVIVGGERGNACGEKWHDGGVDIYGILS